MQLKKKGIRLKAKAKVQETKHVLRSCSAAAGKGREVKGWREKEKGQIIPKTQNHTRELSNHIRSLIILHC